MERDAIGRAHAAMSAVDAHLRGSIASLEILAASKSLESGDIAAFHAESQRVLRTQPAWVNIGLASAAKIQLANAVYWLLAWTADLAAVGAGAGPSFNPDHREALARLARRVARVPLFRYYQELRRQRALLSHPLQPRWVAEALLIEYRKLFSKGQVS